MLNSREVQALNAILEEAIIKSQEEDDGDPIFHEVSAISVNPFDDMQIQSDVYTSLAKKELISCSAMDDESGGEDVEYVCITPKGFEALKSIQGVH